MGTKWVATLLAAALALEAGSARAAETAIVYKDPG